MRLVRRGSQLLLVLCLVAGSGQTGHAQSDPTPTAVAQFRDAQALAVDPMGRVYVADAGHDVVRILDRDGVIQETLGGAGTRSGEFDRPADVDPTNGQSVWVADAGNGRVQRFSEESLFLEAFPVGTSFLDGREQRAFDDGRDGATVQGEGRPVAVGSSSGDDVFVIDGRNDMVLKWDEQRRPERLLGPGGDTGAPQRPVALALDGSRRLYVADRAQQAVFAFDQFGTFVKRLNTPPLPTLQALAMKKGRLWIVCADRVFVWRSNGEPTVEHTVDLSEPLVDVARRGEDLFLLTATTLYRRAPWSTR